MTSDKAPNDVDGVTSSGEPVLGFEILQKIVDLPISTWRYKDEEPHIRHLGPMSQDFAAAFELGDNDKMIMGVDSAGVTFVGIQALYRKIEALEQRVSDLESRD